MMESIRDTLQTRTAKHVGGVLLAVSGLFALGTGVYELGSIMSHPAKKSVEINEIPQIDALQSTWFEVFNNEKLPSYLLIAVSAGAATLGSIGIIKSFNEIESKCNLEQDTPYAVLLDREMCIDWDSLIIDENANQLIYKGITYDS